MIVNPQKVLATMKTVSSAASNVIGTINRQTLGKKIIFFVSRETQNQ
jgi:hypothetical protein